MRALFRSKSSRRAERTSPPVWSAVRRQRRKPQTAVEDCLHQPMKEAVAPKPRLGNLAQPGGRAEHTTSPGRAVRRKSTRTQPLAWPPDPQHTYALWLEPVERPGAASRAYITAHPVYRDIGVHSRFAVRLELPGTYHSRSAAAADGFAIARRFYHGRYSPLATERVKTLNGYSHCRTRPISNRLPPMGADADHSKRTPEQ